MMVLFQIIMLKQSRKRSFQIESNSLHNQITTQKEYQLGGFLKISLSHLHFTDTSLFTDDETILEIRIGIRQKNIKCSRPIAAKWETKKSLRQKYQRVFEGVDLLFFKEANMETHLAEGQDIKEDNERQFSVYMGENIFVFDCHQEDVLNIDLYKKKVNFPATQTKRILKDVVSDQLSEKIAQCFFPVKKMVKLERLTHQIEAILINSQLAKVNIVQEIGFVSLEMIYLSQNIGILELHIIEAKITQKKSKQLTGIMSSVNAYLVIKTAKQEKRTKVDKKGGSHPIWNQVMDIKIKSLQKQIDLILYNDSFGGKKEIGRVCMDMINQDILKYTKMKHTKTAALKDEKGEEVGSVKFQTRFRINTV